MLFVKMMPFFLKYFKILHQLIKSRVGHYNSKKETQFISFEILLTVTHLKLCQKMIMFPSQDCETVPKKFHYRQN